MSNRIGSWQTPVPWNTRLGNAAAQYTEDFFIYTIAFGTIAAAATGTQVINIQKDSYFEWIESTWYANIDGVTEPASDGVLIPVNIQIQDGGSGRFLFSNPLPIVNFAGSGKQPFILPVPRLFQPNSTVTFTAKNFGGSQYDNITLNLIGRKIFEMS